MKRTMLSGDSIRPARHAPGKRRKTKRGKRSGITTTYHEPKWKRDGRKAARRAKQWVMNVLGLIGLITLIIVLFNLAQGGG